VTTELRTRIKMALGRYVIVQKLYNTSFVKSMEENIVSEYLDPKRGETICDVACGPGLYCIKMAKKGSFVYGIDINKQRIEMAKSICKKDNCHFEVADAKNLPFESNFFDKVVSVCALEHFDDDEKALGDMNRVLKKDGILVLTVDSFTYKGINKNLQKKHKNDHHVVNYYSYRSIAEKLEGKGFVVEKHKYFINSAISTFFYTLGIRLKFGYSFKVLYPIAYPSSIISEKFWRMDEGGYHLALKARKI
jgi:ubiquinone/menaquinone biosynthesis C-methylase UbiE